MIERDPLEETIEILGMLILRRIVSTNVSLTSIADVDQDRHLIGIAHLHVAVLLFQDDDLLQLDLGVLGGLDLAHRNVATNVYQLDRRQLLGDVAHPRLFVVPLVENRAKHLEVLLDAHHHTSIPAELLYTKHLILMMVGQAPTTIAHEHAPRLHVKDLQFVLPPFRA